MSMYPASTLTPILILTFILVFPGDLRNLVQDCGNQVWYEISLGLMIAGKIFLLIRGLVLVTDREIVKNQKEIDLDRS